MLDSRLLQSALDTGSSTIYLRGPALRLGPYEVEREVGRGGMGILDP